jgi:hypothetical protein
MRQQTLRGFGDLFHVGFVVPSLESGSREVSVDVVAIQIHDLIPGRDEVVHEFLHTVGTCIDFSQGAQLGI